MKSSSLKRLVLVILLDGNHVFDYRLIAPNLVTLDVSIVDTAQKPRLELSVSRLQTLILQDLVPQKCFLGKSSGNVHSFYVIVKASSLQCQYVSLWTDATDERNSSQHADT